MTWMRRRVRRHARRWIASSTAKSSQAHRQQSWTVWRSVRSASSCKPLPFREQAYADGAASPGFSTENMNPVVLSLFAALFTNDLLDLKARQENIKLNDPKEPGTSLPDYSAVMLRSLAVFLGMIQDMVQENKPPFVSVTITEYMTDTAPDEMFLYWRIFAKRFLRDNKNQCSVTDTAW